MYKLKSVCEDFVVDEMPLFDVNCLSQEQSKFMILKLKKRNWNTVSAVRELSFALGVSSKDINFAGTKDKNAVTSQFVSVNTNRKNLAQKFPLSLKEGLNVEFVGYSNERLNLGSLIGNKFQIMVRNLIKEDVLSEKKLFVNYFDEQRFSKSNVQIGKAIIQKDFKKAAGLLVEQETRVKDALEQNPTDHLKALLTLPKKILMLYLHAYQSYLWNETVSRYLIKKFGDKQKTIDCSQGQLVLTEEKFLRDLLELEIPIIGALPIENNIASEIKEIVTELLTEEGITRYDFVIKQLPNMTPEGGSRKLVAKIGDLDVGKRETDDLNPGSEKQMVEFSLGKGSYATMAIKFLFGS